MCDGAVSIVISVFVVVAGTTRKPVSKSFTSSQKKIKINLADPHAHTTPVFEPQRPKHRDLAPKKIQTTLDLRHSSRAFGGYLGFVQIRRSQRVVYGCGGSKSG